MKRSIAFGCCCALMACKPSKTAEPPKPLAPTATATAKTTADEVSLHISLAPGAELSADLITVAMVRLGWKEVLLNGPLTADGQSLDALPPDAYKIVVRAEGYETVRQQYWLRGDTHGRATLAIQLDADAGRIDVTVHGGSNADAPDDNGWTERSRAAIGEACGDAAPPTEATAPASPSCDDVTEERVAAIEMQPPAHRPWLRLAVLRSLLDHMNTGAVRRSVFGEQLAKIPIESAAWISARGWLPYVHEADQEPPTRALLARLATTHPMPAVRFVALSAQARMAAAVGEKDKEREAYALLKSQAEASLFFDHLRTDLDPDRPLQVGRPMPAFEFANRQENAPPISSRRLAGRPYLLDLWATWCHPCVEERLVLAEAHTKLGGADSAATPAFVSVSFDDDPQAVREFLGEQVPMDWDQAYTGGEGPREALMKQWLITSWPTIVLVDADGMIVAMNKPLFGDRLLDTLQAFVRGEPLPLKD